MIRDPSDGSVREPKAKLSENPTLKEKPESNQGPILGTEISGLPAAKAKDADRHKRSREWLADYRAGKFKPKSEEQS